MSLNSQTPDVIYEYVAGDTLPTPRAIIENLVSTGFTFQLIIKRSDGLRLDKPGTIVDDGSTSGNTTVDFALASTDLIEGTHTGQMKYTDLSSDVTTFVRDISIRVTAAL